MSYEPEEYILILVYTESKPFNAVLDIYSFSKPTVTVKFRLVKGVCGLSEKYSVLFEIRHLYYLPQYLPVMDALWREGNFRLFYSAHLDRNQENRAFVNQALAGYPVEEIRAENESLRRQAIRSHDFDVTVFGKGTKAREFCSDQTLAVLLYHGIGLKSCYYTDYNPRIDIRYVESEYRLKELLKRGFPAEYRVTGFPKLDYLFRDFSGMLPDLRSRLDPEKATLLYAPTFYPSSIESFGTALATLTHAYNVVVKLHNFSWTFRKYRHQRELLLKLARENRHIQLLPPETYNIIPCLQLANVLLTEASSTVFEFLATGKPSIICDFYHLRRRHRIFYRCFLRRRIDAEILSQIDFAYHLPRPQDLPQILKKALDVPIPDPQLHNRRREQFLGVVDGKAAQRVVDDLKERLAKRA
jgi:CDP-glycerol glycerophosphotransferase (TagB/SpsB family)